MSCLHYQHGELFIENVAISPIAKQYGTPCYLYSRHALETRWREFDAAFQGIAHRICYAVKANSNLTILHLLAHLNAGFDIVSLGELERVLKAGGDPKKIVFSGVGKAVDDIKRAIEVGIDCFNVESEPELLRLNEIATQLRATINITLRVNPNVDPVTHAHISTGLSENKFGIELDKIIPLCKTLSQFPALNLIGIASHIGSQITELKPFLLALDCLLDLYQQLRVQGILLKHINIGGGLGIVYQQEQPPAIVAYANALKEKLSTYPVSLILEPGRAIVGNAGVLVTQIEYIKKSAAKNFAIVNAGMNDLLRPALYNAWQDISPALLRRGEKKLYDVAGPVCESADFLGKNRELVIEPGDLLVVHSAGAYGFSMASNYNSRVRPAEVLVDGEKTHLIRRRETIEELFAAENVLGVKERD